MFTYQPSRPVPQVRYIQGFCCPARHFKIRYGQIHTIGEEAFLVRCVVQATESCIKDPAEAYRRSGLHYTFKSFPEPRTFEAPRKAHSNLKLTLVKHILRERPSAEVCSEKLGCLSSELLISQFGSKAVKCCFSRVE